MSNITTFTRPQLYPHQQLARDFIVTHSACGIFLKIGTAKTLSTLIALQDIRPQGHILVVAPLTIARSTWINEIEKWNIPIRTKSLIVDENDRPLSKDERLKVFQQVFDDPPTMYFINQDLLSQTSRKQRVLVPKRNIKAKDLNGLDDLDKILLDTLSLTPEVTQQEFINSSQLAAEAHFGKTISTKAVKDSLVKLRKKLLIYVDHIPCWECNGKGCPQCRFGIIDQMPIVSITNNHGGKKRTHRVTKWPFPTVIIDESHNIKDSNSNRFRALKKIRPAIDRIIELTGTPTPNNLVDLWSQIYLLDEGKALGTKTSFIEKYMEKENPYQEHSALINKDGAVNQVYQRISHLVMSAENTNIPMPDYTIEYVDVVLPKDALKQYRELEKDMVLEIVEDIEQRFQENSCDPKNPDDESHCNQLYVSAANAAVLHGRLLQIASGTIYTDTPSSVLGLRKPPSSTKRKYKVIHTEKIEMLKYLIQNSDGNIIIAYRYVSERDEILQALVRMGILAEVFDGSRSMVARWNDKKIRVMLMHPKSGGPGLNLQDGGHTLIWYNLPDSLGDFQQLNGRLVRMGQAEHVNIYVLIAKGTIDENQPHRLKMKEINQDMLMDKAVITKLPYQNVANLMSSHGVFYTPY